MDELNAIRKAAGLLNESKYGHKFDQFKPPFKNDGKHVIDNNSKELCECKNAEIAKELASILTDMQKMRDASEKFSTLWR